MSNTRKFEDASGVYTLDIAEAEIKLECYLLGSPTGGTGIECIHTIGPTKLGEFLAQLSIKSLDELFGIVAGYKAEDWSEFHQLVMKNQTDTFVWYETDWDD